MDTATRTILEQRIGYTFTDHDLLRAALTHASAVEDRLDSNERLEFLGDAVLGLITCQRLFTRYPDLEEGDMTKVKSAAVSRQSCSDVAISLGLCDFTILGKGMRSGVDIPMSISAGVLEALIAAIYLDGGYDAASAFVISFIDTLIDESIESGHQENYKSLLQQHAQRILGDVPVYRVLDEKGPDHAKAFKVGIIVGARRFEAAWAQSKKQAEQIAARNALAMLGIIEVDDAGFARVANNEDTE
ncbi:MAG: ribonuclease III [Phycisphaerales bacterium]|nr:ribonuclease III [Phycisphaerales bacterium]